MKTRIILNTRHTTKSGELPLVLCISAKGKEAHVPLGISIAPSQWEVTACRVVKHPNCAQYNAHIARIKADVDTLLLAQPRIATAQELKQRVMDLLYPQEQPPVTFLSVYDDFLASKTGRTAQLYKTTLNRIRAFALDCDTMLVENITKEWLSAFDNFLAQTSPSVNARNIHLRNIRAVVNHAIDEGVTSHYPFRQFKIKSVETRKRSLSVEQLRELFNAPTDSHTQEYLDMFKLVFYLIGINLVDLCHLKAMQGDRVEYYRSKTHKFYSIKVEPEALEIINRYRGKKYLLNILDRYKDYRDYTKRINIGLKHIGTFERVGRGGRKVFTPLFPDLTTYWARHSWATIAVNDLDAPFDVVSKALGHSETSGASVTSLYVDYDIKKVDALNRAMIDWVLYGIR